MADNPWRQGRKTIECCFGCKPPKRYPGCGAKCPEYIAEKAQYVADKQREKDYLLNHPAISNYDFNRSK